LKSKKQKQDEAIARKRQFFYVYIENWCKAQPQSQHYKDLVAQHGIACGIEYQKLAEADLVRAAAEAHVDRYGNPLN